jgi:hypothetical protein
MLRRENPGEFFGELGLIEQMSRTAHVIAVDSVTCLVFSYRAATAYDARGAGVTDAAQASQESNDGHGPSIPAGATAAIDVQDVVDRKFEAIAAHRTQYPIDPGMFPPWMLREMMGHEYFVRVHPPPDVETDLTGRS